MAEAKLARLKLLMGDKEFQQLSYEHRIPPVSEPPVILPPAIQTGELQLLSSTPECLPNNDSGPFRLTSEDVWSRSLPESAKRREDKTTNQLHFADTVEPDPEGRSLGQLAGLGQSFCPILAVSKYPYRYLYPSSTTADEVSQSFFATGKFWTRKWTM